LALFGNNTRKFLTELDSPDPDWKRLSDLSRSGVNGSEKARKSGRTVYQVLIDRVVSDRNVPLDTVENILAEMVRKGTDLNTEVDADGSTALHRAAGSELTGLVEVLLRQGASPVSVDSSGRTPLHLAVGKGAIVIAELLVGAGADVSAEDNESVAPIHLAVEREGMDHLIDLLLSGGALPWARTSDGRTPSDIAAVCGNDGYLDRLRTALAVIRGRRSTSWKCPSCGKAIERPSRERIEWYVRVGMWEYLQVTCGRCGRVTEAPLLDGEK